MSFGLEYPEKHRRARQETSRQVGSRITATCIPNTDQARRIWVPLLAESRPNADPIHLHVVTAPDGRRVHLLLAFRPG